MSSLPWSSKGDKASPIGTDKLMLIDSEVIPGPTQNKLATLTDLLGVSPSSFGLLVKNQTELEDEFGTSIIIPDGENWTVDVIESFTLTKPIQIGLGSSLTFRGAIAGVAITYTASGAMFQNENAANNINILRVQDLVIFSTSTGSLLDIVGNIFMQIRDVTIRDFDSLGTVETMFVNILTSAGADISDGILMIEPLGVIVNSFSQSNFGPPGTFVFMTILSTGNPTVTIDNVSVFNSNVDVLFLDPSSGVTSDYTVQNTKGFFNSLFVPGVDLAVTMVSDAAGQARFAAASHGYVIGDRIVHSGFTNASYNGTFVVGSVPTGSEYMAGIAFVSNDSGNTTKAGRDSNDVTVRAINNAANPDSMFTGDSGLEIFGAEITVTINTIAVPEVVTSASWAFSNLERFSIGVNNEGQLNTEDTSDRRYTIGYSGTIEKVGGGSVDVGIVLLKNGSIISFNAPHTVNTGKIQISGSDLVELTKDDTLQVAVINYLDTANIDVSQIGLVVNLA